MYGLQNKKLRLDYFYSTYESDFADADAAKEIMLKVLSELRSLLEWPNTSRWAHKVDFYTLFVELWHRQKTLPLDKEDAADVHSKLLAMSEGVSRVLGLDDNEGPGKEDPALLLYARGVRNSGDVGSRRMRAHGLRAYVWGESGDEEPGEVVSDVLSRLPSTEDLMSVELTTDAVVPTDE